MSRRHGGTITRYTRKPNAEEAAVMLNVSNRYCDELNHAMEHTATVVTMLTGYILQRMEELDGKLDGINTPFSMKLKNRTNHVTKACEEFMKVMEPMIDSEEKRKAYMDITDVIFPSFDDLFDSLRTGTKEPSYELRRRAMLCYHDPYKDNVAEKRECFEDGYVKGYQAAARDIHRELLKLKDYDGDAEATIDLVSGKIQLKPTEPKNTIDVDITLKKAKP